MRSVHLPFVVFLQTESLPASRRFQFLLLLSLALVPAARRVLGLLAPIRAVLGAFPVVVIVTVCLLHLLYCHAVFLVLCLEEGVTEVSDSYCDSMTLKQSILIM